MQTQIMTYQEVLQAIEGKENHLLLANGFNYGLGVRTGYLDIFTKMLEDNHGIYAEAKPMIEEAEYDLEKFLGKVMEHIGNDSMFLKKYVSNKIKLDFMVALHQIVKANIKNVYAEKNEGIYVLLRNFTNYFTLNYDSFLYLLLLNFKSIKPTENNCFVFEPTLEFIQEDLNTNEQNIYDEIKHARNTGKLSLSIDGETGFQTDCNKLTKTQFGLAVAEYAKTHNKNWKQKDIEKVIGLIIANEKNNKVLSKVDDGCRQLSLFDKQPMYDINSESQNLFFLHGAMHITKKNNKHYKITQNTDKALYQTLEDILNNDDEEIVCVFQSDNKLESIRQDAYLSHCYDKLGTLSGNIVIIGSSLADNDNHIFDQINNSNIESVFVSCREQELEKYTELIKEKFPNKKVYLFLAESISYELPENNASEACGMKKVDAVL